MQSVKIIALSGASTLCLALALSFAAPVPASAQESSPAEQTQTQQLNQNITNGNATTNPQTTEGNATYQAQQDAYQQQLSVYKARQRNYVERAANYEAARDRYIAGHARYHRAIWPARYDQRLIVDTRDLLGANVDTSNGRTVGHVVEIAMASGRVDALRVTLDLNRGDVWIESADLRFDADNDVVMTNLDRQDLYEMTHETY
jgi:hypothetical protein